MRSVYFNGKDLASRVSGWKEISWQLIESESINFKKWLAEYLLERSAAESIGAGWYERSRQRRAWRGGHYRRSIQLKSCRLEGIRIPRVEGGGWDNPLIERFKRKSSRFELMVYNGFVLGLSGRKMREYLKSFYGQDSLSQQGVSDIYKKFTRAVSAWHRRPITKQYRYIFWDGKWIRIRGACRHKKVVLQVMGVTEDGTCELLDFRIASGESHMAWNTLAQSLYNRGLRGAGTELMIHDGAPGLIETVALLWPDVKRQTCKIHHVRNLSNRVKRSVRKQITREAHNIYRSRSLEQAEARAQRFEKRWNVCEPKAVRIFMKGLEPTLTFYRLGWESHISKEQRQGLWKSISSTNILERAIEEEVRRIKPMRSFKNNESCERTFYALFEQLNRNPWRLPGFVPKLKSAEILT